MLTGDAFSSGTWSKSLLGLAYVLLVDTNPFPDLVVIFLCTSNIPRYFLEFARVWMNAAEPLTTELISND